MTVPGDARSAAATVADFFFVSKPGGRQEGSHDLLIRIAPYGSSRPLRFLPGASGNVAFWKPVATRLHHGGERVHLGWPGFGPTPVDPAVNGWADLLSLVLAQLDRPCALIAQSMGGVLALQAALARPEQVTHLVLAATSGGLPMAVHGAQDGRPAFRAAHPLVPEEMPIRSARWVWGSAWLPCCRKAG